MLAFEDQHVVSLAARVERTSHGGDQPPASNGARVLVWISAKVCRQPSVESRFAIPFEALQVLAQGMDLDTPRGSHEGIVNGPLGKRHPFGDGQTLLHIQDVVFGKILADLRGAQPRELRGSLTLH